MTTGCNHILEGQHFRDKYDYQSFLDLVLHRELREHVWGILSDITSHISMVVKFCFVLGSPGKIWTRHCLGF